MTDFGGIQPNAVNADEPITLGIRLVHAVDKARHPLDLTAREIIAKEDFQKYGADIQASEIFVSDGAKCDTGNIQEIFAQDIAVAIPDPVYPVYIDTNVMAGNTKDALDGGGYDGARAHTPGNQSVRGLVW